MPNHRIGSAQRLSSRIAIFMALFAAPAVAQEPQTQPAEATSQTSRSERTLPSQQANDDKKDAEKKKSERAPSQDKKDDPDKTPASTPSGTSNDRLFFALPNFLTLENAGKVPPLTAEQKFKVVARSSFDYVQYPWYAFLAGVSQAENSEPGYGQGAAGYGKRFGAATADGTLENFITGAVLPSLLREDPRFFQSGEGGAWHRGWYAFTRIVVTRTDSGKNRFNSSEVVGAALAAGISTYSYHPHADKTLANTAKVWGTQIGYDSLTLVVKEFWPDIRRKLRKKNE